MTTAQHLTQHDREVTAIRKLILQGMKMLVAFQKENRDARRDTDRELKAFRASQRETDRELKVFIQSLRGGTNGHTKRKVE